MPRPRRSSTCRCSRAAGVRATLIARQEIEYLRPVPYGQRPLDVQLWIGGIGGSSVEVCYEIFSPHGESLPGGDSQDEQVLYARASAVVVIVDTVDRTADTLGARRARDLGAVRRRADHLRQAPLSPGAAEPQSPPASGTRTMISWATLASSAPSAE